jgi:hypothetical protein
MSSPESAPTFVFFPFTAAELERLRIYRAAVVSGFYNDLSSSLVTPVTNNTAEPAPYNAIRTTTTVVIREEDVRVREAS